MRKTHAFGKRPAILGSPSVIGKIVYASDAVNTCYEASKTCVAGKLKYEYEERAEYLGNRVKDQHESVLEHSNLVLLLNCSMSYDLLEVLAACRYLKVNISPKISVDGKHFILIGGTIRGYKNLVRDIYNQTNEVLKIIKGFMNDAIASELLLDFADSHCFDIGWDTTNKAARFSMSDIENLTQTSDYRHTIKSSSDLVEFINVDPIHKIAECLQPYGFTIADVIEVCSVTIKFKNMTRIITQQLTRHRNGITQESQRYVSSKNAEYNTPDQFKQQRYNPDWRYGIEISDYKGDKLETHVTFRELGKMLTSIYDQLIEQDVLKEDARYFLPQNTYSTVYMTFTVKSLFQFLQLRCDQHAQAEIRMYANIIRDAFVGNYWRKNILHSTFDGSDDDIIDSMVIPKYMYSETHEDPTRLDEAISIKEETMENVQITAEIPSDPEEEMKDFGLTGDRPAPPDTSMEAAEQILAQYDPNRYADTRDNEKETKTD